MSQSAEWLFDKARSAGPTGNVWSAAVVVITAVAVGRLLGEQCQPFQDHVGPDDCRSVVVITAVSALWVFGRSVLLLVLLVEELA